MSKGKKSSVPKSSLKSERGKSINLWLLLTAIIILPILVNPWGFNRFALPKITFLQIVLILFVIKTLFDLSKGRNVQFIVGKWIVPYSVFLFVALISAILSIHPVTAFFGQINRYDGLTTLISYGLFGIFVSSTIKNSSDLRAVHWSLLVGLLFVSGYAFIQHFGLGSSSWYAPSDIGRVFSTIGNSNLLGAYIALLLPVLISFNFAPDLKKNDFVWLAWIALPVVIAALIFAATRGAWIGSFFALSIFAFLLFRKRSLTAASKKMIVVFTVIVLLAALVFLVAKPPSNRVVKSYAERAKSIFTVGTSAIYRLDIWKLTLRMIADKPLLGSGPDTFKESFFHYRFPRFDSDVPADKAHNDMLQTASTTGLLGFTAFLWFLVYIVYGAKRLYNGIEDETLAVISAAYLSGVIGYLISIQFSFSLPTVAPMFWVLVGAITAISGIFKSPSNSLFFKACPERRRRRGYRGIFPIFKRGVKKNKFKYVYFWYLYHFCGFHFHHSGLGCGQICRRGND